MRRAPILAILAGCAPDESVALWGVVWDGPTGDSPSLPGAEVTVVDDAGEPLAAATTGEDGSFEVVVPGGYSVFVEVRRDGYATTTFPGVVGLADEQRIEDRAIYGLPVDVAEGLFSTFADCPVAAPQGGVVYGQVLIDGLADPITGGSPTVGTGIATVLGADEEARRDACYFDWSGTVYERKFSRTGPSGQFAVFDVQPGVQTIQVEYEVAPGVWMEQAYPVWIPDDPVVLSPWFPFLVPFPLL